MKRTISILAVVCVLAGCAGVPKSSDNISGKSSEVTFEEYEEHLMRYFLNKNDLIIYETISIYRNNDYAEMLEQVDSILLFFFYGIKTDDITRYNNFREIVKTHNLQRLINIFDIIDNNDIALFLEQQEPSPDLNDVYWTLYFSTGDIQYIDHLLIYITRYHNETENVNLYLTARSAMWSIASNAMTYSQVKEYAANNGILTNELKGYILNTDPNRIQSETVQFIRQQREKGIW
ncbi:MAG: hypothetical protein LBH97_04655 [Treponema sp.]|nr:hypothetical protein [Treponema sp.]